MLTARVDEEGNTLLHCVCDRFARPLEPHPPHVGVVRHLLSFDSTSSKEAANAKNAHGHTPIARLMVTLGTSYVNEEDDYDEAHTVHEERLVDVLNALAAHMNDPNENFEFGDCFYGFDGTVLDALIFKGWAKAVSRVLREGTFDLSRNCIETAFSGDGNISRNEANMAHELFRSSRDKNVPSKYRDILRFEVRASLVAGDQEYGLDLTRI